ncbi:hypothetical protein DSO57_1011161 [Entomophthora muscae]|uniref:Uncharacterized protein n=1 Tax=Entomophthora muscae TaxID=34485 RepID=A0ACC2THJ2_9FUNG|nr:hypothetical protein DSO57_1011161 [Entomophthora muscae]
MFTTNQWTDRKITCHSHEWVKDVTRKKINPHPELQKGIQGFRTQHATLPEARLRDMGTVTHSIWFPAPQGKDAVYLIPHPGKISPRDGSATSCFGAPATPNAGWGSGISGPTQNLPGQAPWLP